MKPNNTVSIGRRLRWQRPVCRLAVAGLRSHTLWRVLQQHGALMASVMLGAVATAATTTLPAMAIPLLSGEFHLGQGLAQWTSASFMLAMAGSMLATPWLCQRFGLRRTYALAIGLLLAGALVCASAFDFGMLLLGRLLQGLAAGVMQPVPAVVLLRCCAPAQRGRIGGLMGMAPALAVAIGPGLAGLLMAHFGWRAVFWLALPAGLAALALLCRARAGAEQVLSGTGSPRLDWRGLLLCNLAMVALLNSLVQLRMGNPVLALALLGVAAVAALAFVAWQMHLGRLAADGPFGGKRTAPLLRLALFGYGRFGWGCVATLLYGVLLFGSSYLLPLLMQRCLGVGVAQVGSALLCAGLAMVVAMPLAGRQLDRRPAWPLVSVGFGLLSLALLATPWLGSWGWLPLTAGAALGRLGLGVALSAAYVTALRGLPPALGPQGASLSSCMQSLGGALGVSACGLFLDWRQSVHLAVVALGAQPGPQATDCLALSESFLLLAALGALASGLAWRLRGLPAAPAPGASAAQK